MKNRLYLSVALFVALVFTSGSFAYTWVSGETSIDIIEPTGDIATSNTTATHPDWDSVLTPVTETENLSTNGPGDETVLSGQFPSSGLHWDKVDEGTADGDTTYVYTDSASYQEDLYDINDSATGAGTINYVKVYMVCKADTDNITQASAYIHIKTNGSEVNISAVTVTSNYAAYSYQWDINPQSSANWTWSEISNLQIGIGLRNPNDVLTQQTRCTRVYAEVSYDAPPLEGEVPSGDLFTIVPDVDYTGDLLAKFYLTNTANLTKAYSYLNMKLYMSGSVESGETPNYRLLTLQNGEASLNFDDLEPVSESWTQTSQGDFQAGNPNQVDTTTSSGEVILDNYSDDVTDTYNDETKIASSANVTVSGGQVTLSAGAGSESETLRPNAAGDDTNITTQYPVSGSHYDKVDEVTADDYNTYVSTNSSLTTNWYNTDWKYRNKITINSDNVTGNLVNFPVLIYTTDATWRYTTNGGNVEQSDGGDILFTSSSGISKLDHEIEKYNPTTGELIAWVEVPSLSSSTDTDIYIYYGNASVVDQWNVTGTWDGNYVMVQHLDDDPDTSTTQDSTSNNHDGTKGSANNPLEAPGQIGDAQDFSSDQISCGDLAIGDNYTAECWIKADTLTGTGDYDTYGFTVMASAVSGQGYPLWLTVRGTEVRLWAYESTPGTGGWRETTGAGLNTTDRFHIVATANKSSTTMVYVNGVQRLSFTNDGDVNWTNMFTIGDLRPNRAIDFDGVIDEVRVSNTIRNAEWIETSYNNQDNPGVFYSVGSWETNGYQRDLYNLPASSGSGTITDVTAYFRYALTSEVGDVGIWQDTNNTHTIGATGVWTNVPFNSEVRSDGSFNHTADTTTDITADGWYLIMYEVRSTSTSNTRHGIMGQVTLEGTVVEGSEGHGYSRNDANDEAYIAGACMVNASADDTVIVQWRPYGVAATDVLSNSKTSLCIVRLPDSAIVAYLKYTDDSDTGAYAGTAWAGNEVTWADQAYETDNTTIQKSVANDYTFTLKKITKYLVKYNITFAGGDAVRTQRIARATLAGSAVPQSYSYCYIRNNVATPNTLHAVFIVDNTIANQDLIIQSQRGAANVDGSITRVVSSSSIEIMELPSSAETVITYDNVGGQDVGSTQTLNWARIEEQRDSAAFTLPTAATVEVEQDGDYLFLGNGLIEDPDKTSATRLTFAGDWFVAGVENNIGGHGNFKRGAQGGYDTWQASLNAHTVLQLSADEQVTLRTALEGDVGGASDNTLADQCGLSALRISSLAGSAYARAVVKSGTTVENGTEESTDSGTFVLESYQWTTNPDTGSPWTWSEIDSLQVGVELRTDHTDSTSACTQVYIEVNYTTYYTLGMVNSINLYSGETVYAIDSFDYTVSAIPSGTGLQVQFSQDDANWYNSSGTPGGWDTLSVGSHSIDLSGLSWSGPNLYYKMQFTSDGGGTPVLDEIIAYFTALYTSGDLTSSAYDTADDLDWNWLYIYFTVTEPPSTDVSFQLRSASTQAGLSSATWYGPTGISDYYTTTVTATNPVHDGDRWMQYKAYLTGPGDDTPTLSDITLTYTSAELSFIVEVTGGAYALNTRDSSQWDEGWTVTPEIYCEVLQR